MWQQMGKILLVLLSIIFVVKANVLAEKALRPSQKVIEAHKQGKLLASYFVCCRFFLKIVFRRMSPRDLYVNQ
jgi:hypothetical protein